MDRVYWIDLVLCCRGLCFCDVVDGLSLGNKPQIWNEIAMIGLVGRCAANLRFGVNGTALCFRILRVPRQTRH